MQIQPLTANQKRIQSERRRRNHRVCQLLADNPTMLRRDALRQANREMDERLRGRK